MERKDGILSSVFAENPLKYLFGVSFLEDVNMILRPWFN